MIVFAGIWTLAEQLQFGSQRQYLQKRSERYPLRGKPIHYVDPFESV